tara:strand:- start:637 stop:1626 length:990 start_codon:yes stop_codon:yes gene_type:complete
MLNATVNIGVIGVGHLGQHHVKHYKKLKSTNIIGIYDLDIGRSKEISKTFGVPCFNKLETLISRVDAVSIVTPTLTHAKIAEYCIRQNVHVFIEKPITTTVEEAEKILKLADDLRVIIQVGHIERLNPGILALQNYNLNPKFIEIQRLAPYTTRGTDVPVVLDKMIHDIDIVLSITNSSVKSIRASGLSILTDSIDVANARIRFENGTIASLTSSRIAQVELRKVKIFEKNFYATVDLLLGLTEVYKVIKRTSEAPQAIKIKQFEYNSKETLIAYEKPEIIVRDSLQMELLNFIQTIKGESEPIVSGEKGKEALAVALDIQKAITQDLH